MGDGHLRISPVDAVGLEARAASLAAIDQEVVEARGPRPRHPVHGPHHARGRGHAGQGRALCAKAVRPDPLDPTVPSVAAVCVYPELVPVAAAAVAGTGVHVASVAGAFPPASAPLTSASPRSGGPWSMGADEIDIVLNRSAFLAGRLPRRRSTRSPRRRRPAAPRTCKVILETGELG